MTHKVESSKRYREEKIMPRNREQKGSQKVLEGQRDAQRRGQCCAQDCWFVGKLMQRKGTVEREEVPILSSSRRR